MKNYKEDFEYDNMRKAEFLLTTMPPLCRHFYDNNINSISYKSQVEYIYRIKKFFEYWIKEDKSLNIEHITDITTTDLLKINYFTLLSYSDYLENTGSRNNTINSYIRSVTQYLKNFDIDIERPIAKRQTEKEIVVSDVDLQKILDSVLNGTGFNKDQSYFNERTKYRDASIISLMIETNMTPLELYSLDVDDLMLSKNQIMVTRDNIDEFISINSSTSKLLSKYLEERLNYGTDVYEQALFVASKTKARGKRLNIRSFQRRIKRYAYGADLVDARNITPTTIINESELKV